MVGKGWALFFAHMEKRVVFRYHISLLTICQLCEVAKSDSNYPFVFIPQPSKSVAAGVSTPATQLRPRNGRTKRCGDLQCIRASTASLLVRQVVEQFEPSTVLVPNVR